MILIRQGFPNLLCRGGHQARVKELEIAVEAKDNEVLRELKASNKTRCEGDIKNGVNIGVSEDHSKPISATKLNLDQSGRLQDDLLLPRKVQNCNSVNDIGVHYSQDRPSTMACDQDEDDCSLIGVNISKCFVGFHGLPTPDSKGITTEDVVAPKSTPIISNATSDMKQEALVRQYSNLTGPLSSRTSVDDTIKSFAADVDENATFLFDDVAQVKPMLNIRKESSTTLPLSNPGNWLLHIFGFDRPMHHRNIDKLTLA